MGSENTSYRLHPFFVVIAFLVMVYVSDINVWLDHIWEILCNNIFFQSEMFEPVLSTITFAFWIHFWSVLDRTLPESIQTRYLLRVESKAVPRNIQGHKSLYALKSGIAYLAPLLLKALVWPTRDKLMKAPPISFTTLLCQCTMSIIFYDFTFFWIHWAMHRIPVLLKIHAQHHQGRGDLVSTHVLNHSLVDGTFQVLTNIFVLNVLGTHALARALHDVVVIYMLTEAHSGYDFPWMLHRWLPGYGGAARHEMHHCKDSSKYYQQFFCYLDDWLVAQ